MNGEGLGYGELFEDTPLLEPSKRDFAPWHRPRKQFVRREQWLREISVLLDELPDAPEELRYLSLPGNDHLDIRFLHESLCVPRNQGLRFLGFNTGAAAGSRSQSLADTSLYDVKGMPFISEHSHVRAEDFRVLGREHSEAAKQAQEWGPFHAVNIDLCDGVAASAGTPSMFDAIRWLLKVQSRAIESSVLFLTTRVGPDQVSDDFADSLSSIFDSNLASCAGFEIAVQEELAEPGQMEPVYSSFPADVSFAISFSKWLITQGLQMGFAVHLRSVLTYRIADSSPTDDMISIAFRLSPLTKLLADVTGLAVTNSLRLDEEECRHATKLPARVARRRSVDKVLSESVVERDRCRHESADLLSALGYDLDAYWQWSELLPGLEPSSASGRGG